MSKQTTPRRPGELLLDRYLPNATPEEREEAYENLRGLVRILIEIDEGLGQQNRDSAIRAKSEFAVESELPA